MAGRGPKLRRAGAGVSLLLAAAWLPGCMGTQPYEAWPVPIEGGVGAEAFRVAVALVETEYGGVVLVDPGAFRIQSRWHPYQPGSVPGEKRATVYRENETRLRVAVEVRWLRMGIFDSIPTWSSPRAAPHLERRLGDAVRLACGLP